MKKFILLFTLVAGLLLAACGGDEPVEEVTSVPTPSQAPAGPSPLPTAVPPDSVSSGSWAITYRYDFPDGHWIAGDHTYGFKIFCPNIYDFSGEWIFFRAAESAITQSQPIYLRLNGLSSEPFRPGYLSENRINPDQATAAVVHLVGLSEVQVEQAEENCEVFVAWDRSPPQLLEVADVFEQ
jgi:hypothetical protein